MTFKLDFLSEYASARQTGYTYVIPKTYSKFGGGVIFLFFFLENLHQALIKFENILQVKYSDADTPFSDWRLVLGINPLVPTAPLIILYRRIRQLRSIAQ